MNKFPIVTDIYQAACKEDIGDISEQSDFILMGLSGLLHNVEFSKKDRTEQFKKVIELISKVLDVSEGCLM